MRLAAIILSAIAAAAPASASPQDDAAGLSGRWLLAASADDDAPRCGVNMMADGGAGPYRIAMTLACSKVAAVTGRVHGWMPTGPDSFNLTDAGGRAVIAFTRRDDITFAADGQSVVMERSPPE